MYFGKQRMVTGLIRGDQLTGFVDCSLIQFARAPQGEQVDIDYVSLRDLAGQAESLQSLQLSKCLSLDAAICHGGENGTQGAG